MTVPIENPPGNAGIAALHVRDDLEALSAFADFVLARRTFDVRRSRKASRDLRTLGYSVCLITPGPKKDGGR